MTDNIEQGPNEYIYLFKKEDEPGSDLESGEQIEAGNIVIRDELKLKYMKFNSYEEYEATYKDRNYLNHEVILGWMPKFDLDGGNEQDYADLKECVETAFVETYDVVPQFVECNSSNENKFSRHLIVKNVAFANAREADWFTKEVLKVLVNDDVKAALDWQVNKVTQNFRTPGSVKPDSRKKRVHTPATYRDAFITVLDGAQILPLKVPIIKHADIDIPDMTKDVIEKVMEKVDQNTWLFDKTLSKGNKMVFRRLQSSHCDVCGRSHDRANIYICVFKDCIRQFCYRNEQKKSVVLWQTEAKPIDEPRIFHRNHKVYYADYLKLVDKVHENLLEIKQWARDTIANIVNNGNPFYVTKNEKNGEIDIGIVVSFAKAGINFAYRDAKGKIETISLTSILKSMETEISYNRLDFVPYLDRAQVPKNIFNLFNGFRQQLRPDFVVDETKIDRVLHHVRSVWCLDDSRLYEYGPYHPKASRKDGQGNSPQVTRSGCWKEYHLRVLWPQSHWRKVYHHH